MGNMRCYDLRSDTLTKPCAGMRMAMAKADVGDDVYGEDPTVKALEGRVAQLLGKESALFVPSGTMANQIALLVHTRPGYEVVVGEGTHCMHFEGGAAAAWSGVQFAVVGRGGLLNTQ
jgi:threonine aldolase